MITNLLELITKAHTQSVKSGFWNHDDGCPGECGQPGYNDKPRCENVDPLMKINLIHSELSEALEEYRLTDEKRGGPLGSILFLKPDGSRSPNDVALDAPASDGPRPRKPEGFVVELADAAIRIFDLLGHILPRSGETIEFATQEYYSAQSGVRDSYKNDSRARVMYKTHFDLDRVGLHSESGSPVLAHNGLIDALVRIEHLAGMVAGDLNAAIEIKMAYNATRAFKHGGKRV